jgi:hypothetical protein
MCLLLHNEFSYVFRCYLQCISSGLEHMENLFFSQKRLDFEEEYGAHTS